jgi:hypothetical protein
MAELDGLKNRVEQIDLRLKTAHSARERESAALRETWEQIRDRFQDQTTEISKLRGQIAELEDSRDDLMKMVHSLLEAVEGGLDNMADETVPKIKNMAGQLLADNRDEVQPTHTSMQSAISEYDSDYEPDQEPADDQATSSTGPTFHDDLLTAIERTIQSADEQDFGDEIPQSHSSDIVAETDKSAPASPGIRNLIARIESAVGEEFFEPPAATNDEDVGSDDDLTRDLREIEELRDELHGLRHRISAGAL